MRDAGATQQIGRRWTVQHVSRFAAEHVARGWLLGSAGRRGGRIGRHLDVNLAGQPTRHTWAASKIDR
jgi:hypothetical protein